MIEEKNLAGLKKQREFDLDLYSIKKLETVLGHSRDHLRRVAAVAGSLYRPFAQKKKPKPFQKAPLSRKVRMIDNPSPELKKIQRAINPKLLRPLELPMFVCGGVKGRSVADNVELHLGARVLVTMDIRRFFPSVSSRQIFEVWRDELNCSPRIAALLTKLTTFERHLPQGAPTSTLLANLVLYRVGEQIWNKCHYENVAYSCWVDDLAFSGDNARAVIQTAVDSLRAAGFAVSHNKLKICGPGERKMLTGRMLGRFVSVHPDRLASIRSGIHKLATGGVEPAELSSYVRSLEAKIAHISKIVRHKGFKLSVALEAAKIKRLGKLSLVGQLPKTPPHDQHA
jgi:RNA-directed DNA polymerase